MRLFRVAGVTVTAAWSWLLALGYVVFLLSGSFNDVLGAEKEVEAFVYAVVLAFLFFGSIVLHELGHAVVARRNGIGILGIELWLLGGLAKMDRDPATPGAEFRVAAAGPAVTGAVAAVCIGVAAYAAPDRLDHLLRMTVEGGDAAWLVSVAWLGVVNLLLLIFNLFPAYPLDGGRIARAAVWKITGDEQRGTNFAAALGRVFGAGLIVLGLLIFAPNPFGGVIFIYMGFSIMQSAKSAVSRRGLLGDAVKLTVADVMDTRPVVMTGEVSTDRALEEYFWRYRWPWFPVVDLGGRFVGLVEQVRVEGVDESERATRRVDELVDPASAGERSIRQDTPLTAVLANHHMRDFGALMVVDENGILTGVVTLEQVQRGLRDAIQRASQPPGEAPPAA